MSVLARTTLAAWSAFFWWLWVTGEMVTFIGPRTSWVVPFGAVVTTAAVVGAGWRGHDEDEPTLRDVGAAVVTILPILLLVLVPAPRLGASTAANRSGGLAGGGLVPPPGGDREVTIRDIEYASDNLDYAATLGVTEGRRVELVGFVTHPKWADPYAVTRFEMWCCAADAIPASVGVKDAADHPDDTWLKVEGVLVREGSRFLIDATRVRRVPVPEDPYA